MKSTKIEDILADEIEEASETNINEINQDDVQDELRDQLKSLKSELSMMKKEADVKPTENVVEPIEQKFDTHKNIKQEVSILEKFLKFDKLDFKQTLIISLLYIITNSLYINEFIDNMIPYSLYSYTFVIKLILFIVTFRLLNLVEF